MQKTCRKCGQIKDISEYANNKNTKSGKQWYCKKCMNNYSTKYRNDNIETIKIKARQTRNKDGWNDIRKKYMDKFKINNLESLYKSYEKYRTNNLDKRKAHSAVQRAVKLGKMKSVKESTCIRCGNQAFEYHHWNGYSEESKLDVIPLCRKCHKNEHNQSSFS